MKRKSLVGVLAACLAEHNSRKAVSAPPLKWSRHAALAHCCSWDTLRKEEAARVGANPRNKFFHEGALQLRAMSNGMKKGHFCEHTLLCSGMSGSSIEKVSSTSMDGGLSSCNTASCGSISILTAASPSPLGVCGFLEVFTSTGMYQVPRERF